MRKGIAAVLAVDVVPLGIAVARAGFDAATRMWYFEPDMAAFAKRAARRRDWWPT
jgi:hypothetical protein